MPNNPFEDDGSPHDRVDAEDLEALEKAHEEDASESPRDLDMNVADDDPVDIPFEPEPDTRTRKQKKQDRFKRFEKEAEEAKRRAQELEMQNLRLQQQLLSGQVQQTQAPPAAPQVDPIDAAVDETYEQRKRLYESYAAKKEAGQITPEGEKEYLESAKKLEMRQQELVAEKVSRRNIPQPDPSAAFRQAVQAQHFDVVNNPQALEWVKGNYAMKRAKTGADSMELLNESMDEARQEFRLGKYKDGPPPSSRQKSRYHGESSMVSSGAGNKNSSTIRMSKSQRDMAYAMYPHLDEKEALKTWVREVGGDFQELERGSGRG